MVVLEYHDDGGREFRFINPYVFINLPNPYLSSGRGPYLRRAGDVDI